MEQPHRIELPLANGRPPAERADAARNRRRILDAAAVIVAEQGPGALTMNAVAHATGIGVGTVYRRFGDVSQLIYALLDDRELRFQAAFLSGPPPLGPDAPPAERLRAFLHALTDRIVDQQRLMLAGEVAAPSARYASGPYSAMHTHVATLVAGIRPGADPAVLAHLLLAPLTPSLISHLTVDRGLTPAQIKDGLDELLGTSGLTEA
ncbi:TetR/AcrR family transcriptional regulator [Streptomyces sp. NBC_00249]|uniref:TetR/AcrR family transcriptional regulator n=1 Tax=Streptomyces sp. NBC_00249 TaxID=2975690 RepID=UPI00224CDA0A|nr:TetR/AcrR family transcriptional regulator [Streptomyces sp. NBC_00249]MCX5195279.1 TetR/AcrR family transcriptional regulator [Streptomyces sp. NBC_00249]